MSDLEEWERQVSRYLDGVMSPAERRRFEDALREEDGVRGLLSETAEVDSRAREALEAFVGAGGSSGGPVLEWIGRRRGKHFRLGTVGLATAATLVFAVASAWLAWRGEGSTEQGTGPNVEPALHAVRVEARRDGSGGWADVDPFDFGEPRQMERLIDRGFFGVFDEIENRLYWLEVDRVRTRVRTVVAEL